MKRILAIDPGDTKSAVVVYDPHARRILTAMDEPNETILEWLKSQTSGSAVDLLMACEMAACYGMPVGAEIFDTCVWIGRYWQAWSGAAVRVYRRQVKLHLCGSMRAKDPNVRQALMDKFGPGRERAMGTKRQPGPLYGISGDLWAALDVAVTVAEAEEFKVGQHAPAESQQGE